MFPREDDLGESKYLQSGVPARGGAGQGGRLRLTFTARQS
jgi:hypothetical protein